jgi:hypothetical protein
LVFRWAEVLSVSEALGALMHELKDMVAQTWQLRHNVWLGHRHAIWVMMEVKKLQEVRVARFLHLKRVVAGQE